MVVVLCLNRLVELPRLDASSVAESSGLCASVVVAAPKCAVFAPDTWVRRHLHI